MPVISTRLLFFTSLLLIFFPLNGQALGDNNNGIYAQSQTELPLSNLLDQISEVHSASIIYDSELVAGKFAQLPNRWSPDVSTDLAYILSDHPLTYEKIDGSTYVIIQSRRSLNSPRQQLTPPPAPVVEMLRISGRVTDAENGEALIGVSVLEKGTGNGTISDIDGEFELDVSPEGILVFSYLGYLSQEVRTNRGSFLEVELAANATQLDEVIVIGYGSQKKSDVTGALSSIGAEELKALPVTGLDQALQGRAAGVFVTQNSGAPGGALSIRIRGIGSTLSAEPLYVIDGVPVVNDNQGTSQNFSELDGGGQYSNALNTINPNDIERIEILKDASATAIYGARAANGVVLITTKRGEKGRSSISFETYAGVQEISKQLEVMDLREYAAYFNETSFDQIEEFENVDLLGSGTNWQQEVFRRAYNQNYQLTLSGGSQNTQFAISGGYNRREGIVVGSNFERYSGKINLDHQFSDRFRFGNSLLVSRTNERIVFNDNSSGVVYTALLMVPNAPVRNVDGSFAGPQEEITLSFDNPVARALETNDQNSKTRVLANFWLEADIFPSLRYRTEMGTDLVFSEHTTFFPSFERGNFFGKSGIRVNKSNSNFWINKHLLTFDQTFNTQHHLTALVGFEMQAGSFDYLFASRDNLPNNELQNISLGDAGQQQTNGGAGHWSLLSYFGRLNYNFQDRFLLTATLRADGSSRFGPENRYGLFPSAAFAWRISEEAFLESSKTISNLKIRLGYGAVGNQEIGLYSYLSNIRAYNSVVGDQIVTAFGPANIANPEVRWESSVQTNLGLDVGLWNNRVELVIDVYQRLADGMLLPALIPASAGNFNPPFVNIGEIVNSGLEITLNTVNTQGKLDWRTGFNFTTNTNEVRSLGANGNLVGIIQRIPVTRTEEGRPIGQFYGFVVEGIFQDLSEVAEAPFQSDDTRAGDIRFKDLNEDGIITEADQTFLGNPLPDFTANLSNTLSFSNFDLNILLQVVYGNEILNLIRRDLEGFVGNTNQLAIATERFQLNNPSTTIPRAISSDPNDNRRVSTRFIEDGSFLRLRNLSLGYTLPTAVANRLGMQSARVYVSGQNLFTITDYSGYDPELGSYNQNPLINGVENGRYPISRSYTVGLNINF